MRRNSSTCFAAGAGCSPRTSPISTCSRTSAGRSGRWGQRGQVVVVELGPQQGHQGAAVGGVGGALFRQKRGQAGGGGDAGGSRRRASRATASYFASTARSRASVNQTNVVPPAGQPQVGVVLAQQQAVFTAGGHDAVRFVGSLGDKIVDEVPM